MYARQFLTDGSRYIEWADIMRIHGDPCAVEETKPEDRFEAECRACMEATLDCLSYTEPTA